jgi:hypothetical protein
VLPYSTNSEERFRVPFFVAALAVVLAWALSHLYGAAHLPFFVDVPGTFTLYVFLLEVFRKYWWKFSAFRYFRIVRVPNLEGEWAGYVTSSYDDAAEKQNVTVCIKQNWTHIFVKLVAQTSNSRSIVGSIYVSDAETILSYQYENEPLVTAVETMHAHIGTATLEVTEDWRTLTGSYYTGRDRGNHGMLVLKR